MELDDSTLRIGQLVEVRKQVSWHPGKIVDVQAGIRVVEYETGGKESVVVRRSSPDEAGRLRPRPPFCSAISSGDWKKGLFVDAYRDSWREGVLMESPSVLSTHVQVYFPEDGEQQQFCLDNLRVSQLWSSASNIWNIKGYDPHLETIPEPDRRRVKPPQRTYERKRKRTDTIRAESVEVEGGDDLKKPKQQENGRLVIENRSPDGAQNAITEVVEYVDVEPMQGVEVLGECDTKPTTENADGFTLARAVSIPVCCVNTQSEDPLFGDEQRAEEGGLSGGDRQLDTSSQGSFYSQEGNNSDLNRKLALSVSRMANKKRKVPAEYPRRDDTLRIARENVIKNLERYGWTRSYRERQRENRTSHEAFYIAPDGTSHHSLTSACQAWLTLNKDVPQELRDEMLSYQMQINNRRTNSSQADTADANGVDAPPVKRKSKRVEYRRAETGETPKRGRPRSVPLLARKQEAGDEKLSKQLNVCSWLIDLGVVPENATVSCVGDDPQQIQKGELTRDGIRCNCCNQVFPIFGFRIHSGINKVVGRAASGIHLDDGRSILDCQREALKKAEVKPAPPTNELAAVEDECCGSCGEYGQLICCDHCPATFHPECMLLKGVPDGDWFCPKCRCPVCGKSIKGRELLYCAQCERRYHVECLNERLTHSRSTFCSQTCFGIFFGLKGLVGLTNPMDGGFSWRVIRSDSIDHDTDPDAVIDNSTKASLGLAVIRECFSPMIDPRTNIDIIAHILSNRSSNVKRLDFSGFYSFLLEKQDEIISVAAVRVYGTSVAEMPLIGTRLPYRRQGMCRRLMEVIERVLRTLNVNTIVLPAVSEHVSTWTHGFGFQKVAPPQTVRLLEVNILGFPGTQLLHKPMTWLNMCRKVAPPLAEKPWAPGSQLHIGIYSEPHRKPKPTKQVPVFHVKGEQITREARSLHVQTVHAPGSQLVNVPIKEELADDARAVVKTRSNREVRATKRYEEYDYSELKPIRPKKPDGEDVELSNMQLLTLGSSQMLMDNIEEIERTPRTPQSPLAESPISEDRRVETVTRQRMCHECRRTETPIWRKDPDGNKMLCNACGIRLKKMQRYVERD